MSNTFNLLIDRINNTKLKFVDETLKKKIYDVVIDFFPNLNLTDLNILQILTTITVDLISFNYNFDPSEPKYFDQWMQNSNRDIKGVILLLLPFIDDKDNSFLLKKLKDLNHLLYAYSKNNIPLDALETERDKLKSTHFIYGNMGIGLIKPMEILRMTNKDNLLDLYDSDGNKLIYNIIHHNFIGLLQTLEIINGKTYINWVNISPINLNEYNKSNIFLRTKERLNNLNQTNINNILVSNLIDYGGLWFGDFYNILRTRYYEEAKSIKWLFFAYETPKQKIYLIQGLNLMLDINKIISSDFFNWDNILDIDKLYFDSKINDIIIKLSNNELITSNNKLDFEILKYTLIYLFTNSLNNDQVYRKFILNSDEESYNDFSREQTKKINTITDIDIINCLKYVKINYLGELWDFIKLNISNLETSAYGKFLINPNTKKINDIYYWEPLGEIDENDRNNIKNKLNLKNIYNIAKSLSHNMDWTLCDKNFISFNLDNKKNFLLKIKGIIPSTAWINLTSNLRRQFIDTSYNYTTVMNNIMSSFTSGYIYLIFEELITTGILNKFTPNLQITDKMLLPQNSGQKKLKIRERINNLFKANPQWLDSYYYITNKQFKYLDLMRLDKAKIINPKNKYTEMTYFNIIPKDHDWPVFYAMDWISQISFFQHYIYHQVMYVTGATGQGKSTQVPKLLLYAMKCIDYKSNGNVICTQPRVPPTVGNATRIAEELGVPIEKTINTSSIKMKTDNFYVQYKHQAESHTISNTNFNILKIVTDGTLLSTLLANPTLKKTFDNKLINTNIYDIVIVDEAHEHNTNMDIIIALTKQACYVNNQVRLIIVSATMDDDEPIYRRYFYNINDKLLFPLKNPIIHPFLNINFLPLPIYMDRRYHISPPGTTTQYRVEENYLDYDPLVLSPNNNIDMRKTADNAQKLGYKKIEEICTKSINGEILFFANGKGEILEAVKYLNSILPPGNIALPYFAEMNETYKNIISKINLKISTIRNRRDKIHEEWGIDFIEDLTVPLGIYKRSIIIATNVAEASVTIPNLVYVVDNGYSKVNSFNSSLGISKLGVEMISESSRVQRKGRVGRIGDGVVYYMYRKEARKYIKPKYKITQDDIKLTMLQLLGTKEYDKINTKDLDYKEKLIVSNEFNPNILATYTNQPNDSSYIIKSNLYNIYLQNYYINGNIPDKIFFSDTPDILSNENNIMTREFLVFNDGQIFANILDIDGQFYLIHPFENSIKRNILNNIIEFELKPRKEINQIAFKSILNDLQSYSLVVDANKHLYDPLDLVNNLQFVKTELGEKVCKLEFPLADSMTLISASAMGCLTEVYEIKVFIDTIGSIKSLISPEIDWSKFYEIYGNIKSDFFFIYNIIYNLRKNFPDLYVFNIFTDRFESILNQHSNQILEKFIKLSKQFNEPPENYNIDLWNNLNKLKNHSNDKDNFTSLTNNDSSTLFILMDNIDKYSKEITKWANRKYLNSEAIINFLNKLSKYYLTKPIINNPVLVWAQDFNSNFNKYLTNYTLEEKIVRSFLYGKQCQFTFRHQRDYLQTLLNYQIFRVSINKNLFGQEETLVKLPSNFYFYYTYTEDEKSKINTGLDSIKCSWISYIEPEWLIPAFPLFYNPSFNDSIRISTNKGDYTIDFLKSQVFNKISKKIINNWNQNYNIWDSHLTPILRDFYRSVTKILSNKN